MRARFAWLVAVVAAAVCGLPWRAHADEIEPLDADFLEYLAGFGGDEDSWVLFTDEGAADEQPAEQAQSKSNESKPARKPDGGKKTEAAAQPADDR